MQVPHAFRRWEQRLEKELLAVLVWLGASEAPETWPPPRLLDTDGVEEAGTAPADAVPQRHH